MKKIIFLFIVTLLLGLTIFAQEKQIETEKPTGTGQGSGVGSGTGNQTIPKVDDTTIKTPLQILSKPRPRYTDVAREKGEEGFVTLRVTFLSTGQIGAVTPVTTLGYGLTEQAIAAAKQIEFNPPMKNGQPYSVAKIVQFNFSLFYEETDKEVAVKPEIIEMPAIEFASETDFKDVPKTIRVEISLNSDGTASVSKFETKLSPEIEQKVKEAVEKIKFNPAVRQDGRKITVIKVVEYEVKSNR